MRTCTSEERSCCTGPVRFVRVHRSAIVNIESILHLEPISHGEFEVILFEIENQQNLSQAAGKEIGSIAVVHSACGTGDALDGPGSQCHHRIEMLPDERPLGGILGESLSQLLLTPTNLPHTFRSISP
jgi:LytTr DNA-binding domain-containing protein